MSTMRCFVAFDLPRGVIEGLTAARTSICETDPRWTDEKWVRPENLHLTVSFLGEIESGSMPLLIGRVGHAIARLQPVRFRVESLVAKPKASRATMVWASVDDAGTVRSAASAVGSAIAASAAEQGGHRFMPHITLVRARRALPVLADLEAAYASSHLRELVVSDPPLTLYESRLTPQGPHYTPHASWSVGNGAHEVDVGAL